MAKLSEEIQKNIYNGMTDADIVIAIKALEEVTSTHQVTAGVARGYLVSVGSWKTLKLAQSDINDPLFELADAVITTASSDGAYFGLNPTTQVGQINLQGLTALVTAGALPSEADFIALGDKTTKPFENVTEAEVALARLEGEQSSTVTNYPAGLAFITRLANKKVRIFVNATNPAPIDTLITITMYGCSDLRDNTNPTNFLRNARTMSATIKAGESGTEIPLTMPTARWLKFDAVANKLIGEFELDVQEA